MKLQTTTSHLAQQETKLCIVGCFQNEIPFGGPIVLDRVALEGFTGKVGEHFLHFPRNVVKASRLLVVGLGPRDKFSVDALRKAMTAAFKQVKALKIDEVTVAPVAGELEIIGAAEYAENVALYAGLVDYVINHYKTAAGGHKPEVRLATLTVTTTSENDLLVAEGLNRGGKIAAGVTLARDLANMPAGELTPRRLAEFAEDIADNSEGKISCKVYGKSQLKRMGANALLAVARGSRQEPVLIELDYKPSHSATREVLCLVGKSVTFDSGGLNLKPADGMRTMKRDMAGGADVLAAIMTIAALDLPIPVKAVLAATENLPDGDAYKPGDVISTMKGLSVEIDNTDAEGRLTLADAIEFSKRKRVSRIIDLATLTGAVRMIGADVGAAAFSNNDEFASLVSAAAQSAGERLVVMPMWDEFRSANHTDIADLKNSGGDPGSITAAWFLREFAGEETPWVHIDIAGPSYRTRELGADPKGCTGYGVRTLVELARKLSPAV